MKKQLIRMSWLLAMGLGMLGLGASQTAAAKNSDCPKISPLFSNPCYDLWGWCDGIIPGAGFDFKWTHLSGKRDWKFAFPKYYPEGNLYFLARFHKYFSLELGYEQSVRRSKDVLFPQGGQFFGHNLSGFAYRRSTEIRLPHADLNYLLCLTDNLEFLGSVGVGDMLVKTKQQLLQNTANNADIANALLNLRLRHTAVFRARLGLQWLVTPCIGMRAMAGFDNSGHIHVRDSETFFRNNQILWRPFKEAVSGSIGLFVQYQ